jgi:catecholate siderophore receptor
MTSGWAGFIYKPRTEGSIYLVWGNSFNPSAEGLSLGVANVALEPEKTTNYELGTKWDLFRQQLSATAALFRTEKTNARTPGVNPGDPPTVLAGRQRVQGFEMGISGRIQQWWTAIANYAFMRSEIDATTVPTELNNNMALVPENTVSIWTTFQLPHRISLGGGAQFMDTVFRNSINTAEVPSYWLLNAVASYDVNTHFTLRLNGTNLADERYIDRIGGGHYIPGPGFASVSESGRQESQACTLGRSCAQSICAMASTIGVISIPRRWNQAPTICEPWPPTRSARRTPTRPASR